MWANKPLDFVMLPNDSDGFHYGLFKNQQLVSVISMFVNNNSGQFRKFATDKTQQGNGYGTQLLTFLIEEAKNIGLQELTCDARVSAVTFYERFGMKTCSEIFQKSGKDYVKMIVKID